MRSVGDDDGALEAGLAVVGQKKQESVVSGGRGTAPA